MFFFQSDIFQNLSQFSVLLASLQGSSPAFWRASSRQAAEHPWLGTLNHGKAWGLAQPQLGPQTIRSKRASNWSQYPALVR